MTDTVTTINPATEEEVATYELMDESTALAAVDACHAAFDQWRTKSLDERAEVVGGLAKALKENKEELAQIMMKEMGRPISDCRMEVELCAGICSYTAKEGPQELADQERSPQFAAKGIVTFSPLGVIYGIQPWNFPAYQVIRYAVANLMTGNGVLLKHAANCFGTGVKIGEIFERGGLPKNLFTVLMINHDVSDKVIEHDKVRGVTLTGSDKAGRAISELAGKLLKPTVLELGSNDAYLVLSDADLDKATKICSKARMVNNGQTCISGKRFVVVDSVYEAFMEKFTAAMEKSSYGDPADENTKVGPMARKDLREGLQRQVDQSVEKGAKVRIGGSIPDGKGYYYPATILENVGPGMPAYDDELFGPVASVIRAKDDEDAMRIANDSRYGLGGGIISENVDRAVEMASKHFDTGMIFVNSFGLADPSMPFGGVKNSGHGREHGGFGIKEFANVKSIFVGG